MQVGTSSPAGLSATANQVRLAAHIAQSNIFPMSDLESSDHDSTTDEFMQDPWRSSEPPRGMPDVVIECAPGDKGMCCVAWLAWLGCCGLNTIVLCPIFKL